MSNSSFDAQILSRRYVVALFSLAENAQSLEVVAANLAGLKKILAENIALRQILHSPIVSRAKKAAIMGEILDQAKAADLTKQFVARVAANNRLEFLTNMADEFASMLIKKNGELSVEIISAAALGLKQVNSIKAALEKSSGKKIIAKTSQNPQILGGIMIKVGSRLLDYSVAGKIQRLGDSLKATLTN